MNINDLPPKMREQARIQIKEQEDRLGRKLAYPWLGVFEFKLESANKYGGKNGHVKRAQRKEEFKNWLTYRSLSNVYTPTNYQLVAITRVLGKKERLFDDGNLEGGDVKQLVDAMTEAGFWTDDSPKYIKVSFRQDSKHRPAKGCTVVSIQLLNPTETFNGQILG